MGKKWIVLSVLVVLLSVLADYSMNKSDTVSHLTSSLVEDYSWNEKITLVAHHNGETFSGSSVISLNVNKNRIVLPDANRFDQHMIGVPPFVDIPGYGTVFATLVKRSNTAIYPYSLLSAANSSETIQKLREVSTAASMSLQLRQEDLPLVLMFRNSANRSSVYEMPEGDVKIEIHVEKTKMPATAASALASKLPWINSSKSELSKMGLGAIPIEGRYFYVDKSTFIPRNK